MIFSNKVILILRCSAQRGVTHCSAQLETPPKLFDEQRAIRLARLTGKTITQKLHDLILQRLATRTPPPRPCQLLHATPQTAEMQDLRLVQQLLPQFITQPRK